MPLMNRLLINSNNGDKHYEVLVKLGKQEMINTMTLPEIIILSQ